LEHLGEGRATVINRASVLCLLFLLVGAPAFAEGGPPEAGRAAGAPREQDLYMGGFEGIWAGKLRTIDPAAFHATVGSGKPGTDWEHAIIVSGSSVKIMFRVDGTKPWKEVKPGTFRIVTHKTNATVYAIDSASDVYDTSGSGGWVESWTYSLTHKDSGSLYAGFWRAVSNYLRKPDEKSARFFGAAFGELRKVPSLPN
jgi:hypothetical protein